MKLTLDIEKRIAQYFSDTERVYSLLEKLTVPDNEITRVIRCILYLSDSDYDSVDYWVRTANKDRRDVYYFAEYDNRDVRQFDFNFPFDQQS